MKLCDIIRSNNWFNVESTIREQYAVQASVMDKYRNAFESLRVLTPENSGMKIILVKYELGFSEDHDAETYVGVGGQNDSLDETVQPVEFALEWMEWEKWLGMELAPATGSDFSEWEIIAHCLYTMTFHGFNNDAIKDQCRALYNGVETEKR